MDAINVVLLFGASLLALFTFLFLAGAAVHLVSLLAEALRAVVRRDSAKAPLRQLRPASRRARRGEPAMSFGWLKPAAVALSVMVAAYVAITMAEEVAASLHAMTSPAVQSVAATPASAATAPDAGASAGVGPLPVASDRAGLPAASPRECSLAQGVVTDCTFD